MATTLTSVSPSYSPIGGGSTITLTGSWNAAHSFVVTIGGVAATSITTVSATSITCITGAATTLGLGNVVVTDLSDFTTSTLINGFVYLEPGQMCLGQIRTYAQQRSDMVNSPFITTSEWNAYITQSLYELYDLLITTYGNDYYVADPVTVTTDGTSQRYALPTGVNYSQAAAFYKLLGVDLSISGGTDSWVTLKTFKFNERNRFSIPNIQTVMGVTNLRYRLNGSKIMFNIIPAASQTLRLWYIPRLNELVKDTDVADGVSGWLEYVIVDAAIKAMQKEESDVSVLAAQKSALIKRINDSAENRDAGDSQCVSDTSSAFDEFPYNGGFGGGGWG